MDVVWFAEIKWDYLRTRKQQIISRKPDDVRLLYLEPYVRGRENRFELRRVEGCESMWRATVPFVKAIPDGWLRRASDSKLARAVVDLNALARAKKLTRSAGFDRRDAAVITSNIYAAGVVARFGGRFIVYDCNDAHSEFPGMPGWTRDYYEESCRIADQIIATSSVLVEEITSMRGGADEDVTFIGNGVDFAHFESERRRIGSATRAQGPCCGYLGALAPWFDFDVVERLATERSDWKVRMVGPVLPGVGDRLERLARLPNVEVEPAVSYDRVPEIMNDFTVGLIPFRYDGLTRAVNPNKMYEYLAMGVPVVATRFSPEVERYPGLVTAAADADEFLVACDEFVRLADDPTRTEVFRADASRIAGEHDWDVIAQTFWNDIRARYEV
jgi:glycosyltransferase involved in cell wall biosynthesis